MKYSFKYLKCFESWRSEKPKYLGHSETQDFDNVKKFVQEHNLSHLILDIWEHGKNQFNVYPRINNHNTVEYISGDACRLIIDINNDNNSIKKIKIEKTDGGWKERQLHHGVFSYPAFNVLMGNKKTNTNKNIKLSERPHGVAA